MATLDGFMAAPASKAPKFQWWTLYGEAGSGKSRMGLELCHKYRGKNWRAGFLQMKGCAWMIGAVGGRIARL